MEHQYPGAISGDENMLAELMLPDQVHNRKEDWTIFFLHKDTSEEGDMTEADRTDTKFDAQGDGGTGLTNGSTSEEDEIDGPKLEKEGIDHEDDEGGEGPPLIYVLNLVNTKHDASVKRYLSSTHRLYEISLDNVNFTGVLWLKLWQSVRDIHFYTFTR